MPTSARSYAEYCGLAQALDIVGERWTLLVVRELLFGPRRFGDLQAGLPGISTDLLTARLRTLEAVGAVQRRRLPPPASVRVYELTEFGRGLRKVLSGLAAWGAQLLPPPGTAGYELNPAWGILSIAGTYRGGVDDGDYDLVIEDRSYCVHIADGQATVSDGPSPAARATITASAKTFLMFIGGFLSLAEAKRADLHIAGSRQDAERLLRQLIRPPGHRSVGDQQVHAVHDEPRADHE